MDEAKDDTVTYPPHVKNVSLPISRGGRVMEKRWRIFNKKVGMMERVFTVKVKKLNKKRVN